ncbi:MAG: hypothetical protein N2111_12240 [Candidatus Sumerlaeaceae bacterium]|nr:hypothetical protein [Candidatus Sumerlaeaceae bacterium]
MTARALGVAIGLAVLAATIYLAAAAVGWLPETQGLRTHLARLLGRAPAAASVPSAPTADNLQEALRESAERVRADRAAIPAARTMLCKQLDIVDGIASSAVASSDTAAMYAAADEAMRIARHDVQLDRREHALSAIDMQVGAITRRLERAGAVRDADEMQAAIVEALDIIEKTSTRSLEGLKTDPLGEPLGATVVGERLENLRRVRVERRAEDARLERIQQEKDHAESERLRTENARLQAELDVGRRLLQQQQRALAKREESTSLQRSLVESRSEVSRLREENNTLRVQLDEAREQVDWLKQKKAEYEEYYRQWMANGRRSTGAGQHDHRPGPQGAFRFRSGKFSGGVIMGPDGQPILNFEYRD